ncbi:MAG TPA: hypothetical protein VKP69_21095 [Isosphaeraceae bacterium]|nr:hypothetical protein [Isosphaeraceae bacterium]
MTRLAGQGLHLALGSILAVDAPGTGGGLPPGGHLRGRRNALESPVAGPLQCASHGPDLLLDGRLGPRPGSCCPQGVVPLDTIRTPSLGPLDPVRDGDRTQVESSGDLAPRRPTAPGAGHPGPTAGVPTVPPVMMHLVKR